MPISMMGAMRVAPLLFLSSSVSAQTVISELLYDASGSDAGKVHAPRSQLDEEENVQSLQEQGIDG